MDKNVPGEYTDAITFKLMITDATDVILESHWGTSSYYSDYQISSADDERYIISNEEIKMIVTGTTGTSGPTTATEPNTTTGMETTVTEPTVTEPAATEPTDTTASTETQPAEEAAGTPTTEAESE